MGWQYNCSKKPELSPISDTSLLWIYTIKKSQVNEIISVLTSFGAPHHSSHHQPFISAAAVLYIVEISVSSLNVTWPRRYQTFFFHYHHLKYFLPTLFIRGTGLMVDFYLSKQLWHYTLGLSIPVNKISILSNSKR